jgi:hypothetical protein
VSIRALWGESATVEVTGMSAARATREEGGVRGERMEAEGVRARARAGGRKDDDDEVEKDDEGTSSCLSWSSCTSSSSS